MISKPNILFTATFITPFIKSDLQLLQKKYAVHSIIDYGIKIPFKYFKAIINADITFSWFASVYASFLILLTKLFRKKSILILGGVDVAREKKLDYGIWNSWWKSILVRFAITHANKVLAVDDFIKREAMNLCRYDGRNIQVVPTGYDTEFWRPSGIKQDFVLTVANCPDMKRIKIKGIDFLIEVAKKTKDIEYTVIGINTLLLPELNPPENMKVIPSVQQNELLSYYQKAGVYFQPSYREGLPNSLCEAMLCECFPIGTRVGGIPTAIGETGITVNYGNIIQTADAITSAIRNFDGKPARERIANKFSIDKREGELISLIISLRS